ncbi:hypothetical protein GGS21DRAFT_535744, partial [Xylaria nigripes]
CFCLLFFGSGHQISCIYIYIYICGWRSSVPRLRVSMYSLRTPSPAVQRKVGYGHELIFSPPHTFLKRRRRKSE